MPVMDHWHPVLRSSELGSTPVGIRLDGNELVLFRCSDGRIGCLDDVCPHRRMRLSLGEVVNDRLQCPYHGWSYDCEGRGRSPGTPQLSAKAPHYDAAERHGAIWVKSARFDAALPRFETEGFYHLGNLSHRVLVPFELVLDNFTEIEHTATTHLIFGYDLARMAEVEVDVQATDSSVRCVNQGPAKRMPWLFRALLGLGRDCHFNDDWTVYFSPVYGVFDHRWIEPRSGREGKLQWRAYVFYVPVDRMQTIIQSFLYVKSSYPGPHGGVRIVRPLIMRLVDYEIRCDVGILENLADKSAPMDGMSLSRFDRNLVLQRERIDRIYRGTSAATVLTPGQSSSEPVDRDEANASTS